MVTAVPRQYGIARMRVDYPFGRAHEASLVGETNFHLTLQFSCLDMPRIAGDLGGVPALTATAKYQLIPSFVILFIAAIIHKQAAVLGDMCLRRGPGQPGRSRRGESRPRR
jgi:hypothetical protein